MSRKNQGARISKREFIIPNPGKRPSLKRPSLKRQWSKLKMIRKKREIVDCKTCKKSVLNSKGNFQLGTTQTGSDDGKYMWSYHEKCYKYRNHFCNGEEVWMKICAECEEEEEKAIKEFNEVRETNQGGKKK